MNTNKNMFTYVYSKYMETLMSMRKTGRKAMRYNLLERAQCQAETQPHPLSSEHQERTLPFAHL